MVRAQLLNNLIVRNFSNNGKIDEIIHKRNKGNIVIKIVMINDTGGFLVFLANILKLNLMSMHYEI
ncbi:hypothetical protein RhiirA5_368149 [Rhizophagus irregularis]|uniref:Uncharacterized protein n=2 Tax=Rhizophagus irregularis TaxID=588596 RepID=A0A2I1F9X2_9GLOM|nr:hypothetical protein RhiirA5_368149 [Rhizophagus irregularis]PKC58579.1 hypothetical protein RhiirA1_427613 [Rhizophagus irregularis]PKK61489.1 hypothetical protein RhiirC2_760646 [Rhizophagus irregularis]PKY31164.1 hypothetical protein RhiirB3_419339 [Rhizophagus irregularis]